jgi:NAD(P)-dependent dehydrogenase (short-subunit alcohol dehydrogenase family)
MTPALTLGSCAVPSLVITGVSSGIGYETAKLAITKGARVFGSVRSATDGDRLKRELGSAYTPLIFDVRDEGAVRAEAARIKSLLSGHTLSGLVNNAAIGIPGPLELQSIQQIRDQIETNLLSVFIVTQAFLPHLGLDCSLKGKPGRIINISSLLGRIGVPFGTAVCASKFGLEGLSEALRRELRFIGIKVIVMGPSAVMTASHPELELLLGRYGGTVYGEAFDTVLRAVLNMRESGMEPSVVAEAVWHALVTSHPRLRYSPWRPSVEQALYRALPRRLLDWTIERRMRRQPVA